MNQEKSAPNPFGYAPIGYLIRKYTTPTIVSLLVTGLWIENKFGKKILDVIGAMYSIKFFHPNDAHPIHSGYRRRSL